jgi:hypothetical protein
LLLESIKRLRKLLNKKRDVKRLYGRKKQPVNAYRLLLINRKLLYNVKYVGTLLGRSRRLKKPKKRPKERLNALNKCLQRRQKSLLPLNAKKSSKNAKITLLSPPPPPLQKTAQNQLLQDPAEHAKEL